MKRITYAKSQKSDALSAEDWDILERLLRSTISVLGKEENGPVTFIHFRYAPNTIEVELAFTD
jgi:hypothetical protein